MHDGQRGAEDVMQDVELDTATSEEQASATEDDRFELLLALFVIAASMLWAVVL